MIATGDEVILVYTGSGKPNKFIHWYWYEYTTPVARFLETLNPRGGYGKAYYYSHGKIWFRKEKYLTMYLLIKE